MSKSVRIGPIHYNVDFKVYVQLMTKGFSLSFWSPLNMKVALALERYILFQRVAYILRNVGSVQRPSVNNIWRIMSYWAICVDLEAFIKSVLYLHDDHPTHTKMTPLPTHCQHNASTVATFFSQWKHNGKHTGVKKVPMVSHWQQIWPWTSTLVTHWQQRWPVATQWFHKKCKW